MIECLPSCQSADQPAEISADQVRRLRAVVRRPALRAHGQGARAPSRARDRAGRAGDRAVVRVGDAFAVPLLAADLCALLRRPCRRMPSAKTRARGDAFGHQDPRSDLDHRQHRAQPRLHGLGHAVRDGREARRSSRRWSIAGSSAPTGWPTPSPCATACKWHDGQPVTGRGLHRLAQALGRARLHRPEADELRRQLEAVDDKTFRIDAEGALRPASSIRWPSPAPRCRS